MSFENIIQLSIISYLKQKQKSDQMSEEIKETLSVAIECLENCFPSSNYVRELPMQFSLENLFKKANEFYLKDNGKKTIVEPMLKITHPFSPPPSISPNQILMDQNEPSISSIKKAISCNPTDPALHLQLATFYLQQTKPKDVRLALHSYQDAYLLLLEQQQNPSTPAALKMQIQQSLKDLKSTLQFLSSQSRQPLQSKQDFSSLFSAMDGTSNKIGQAKTGEQNSSSKNTMNLSSILKNPSFIQMASDLVQNPTLMDSLAKSFGSSGSSSTGGSSDNGSDGSNIDNNEDGDGNMFSKRDGKLYSKLNQSSEEMKRMLEDDQELRLCVQELERDPRKLVELYGDAKRKEKIVVIAKALGLNLPL